ncbi:cupin domain-containing protein [Celeribacter baekdonensis]|uniref:XRE family transcriptional regulator n=1 Tax=Celeribacter baekdonensis B30 TaxID=1208323 RepID=K2IQK1_9RHOB|nr:MULTISPECIES: cupin domain-containing protein [Roseobacteraceae]EKE72491.1 XRE family transcriptional regulator [Celeribacter baekdonensis B30]KAB6715414.1 cupin domain-containing protein [Roseobacter sp. TSBP12]|tara:strand:- start:769 stop:1377 length:609 start_codon:yes stop_codon:yes gene_type:complete
MNTSNTQVSTTHHQPHSGVQDDLALGHRLRVLRDRAGLSQRALAKKVGVPNSTISLIESGKMNPSVGALRKILDGIPVRMSEFFAFEPDPERQIFYAAEDLVEIGKGKLSLKQVGSTLFGRAMMLLKETYQPGADTGRVMYGHEAEEGGIVISGRIEITVGEERKILGPGDAYYFDSRTPHRFRQVGPEPCVMFSACTPPTF